MSACKFCMPVCLASFPTLSEEKKTRPASFPTLSEEKKSSLASFPTLSEEKKTSLASFPTLSDVEKTCQLRRKRTLINSMTEGNAVRQ